MGIRSYQFYNPNSGFFHRLFNLWPASGLHTSKTRRYKRTQAKTIPTILALLHDTNDTVIHIKRLPLETPDMGAPLRSFPGHSRCLRNNVVRRYAKENPSASLANCDRSPNRNILYILRKRNKLLLCSKMAIAGKNKTIQNAQRKNSTRQSIA